MPCEISVPPSGTFRIPIQLRRGNKNNVMNSSMSASPRNELGPLSLLIPYV